MGSGSGLQSAPPRCEWKARHAISMRLNLLSTFSLDPAMAAGPSLVLDPVGGGFCSHEHHGRPREAIQSSLRVSVALDARACFFSASCMSLIDSALNTPAEKPGLLAQQACTIPIVERAKPQQ